MANTFNLLGDIVANDGERWFESDVTPTMFVDWLKGQSGDIEININSNGGDVAGGLSIANAIKGYNKGSVTCNVLGVAASMASVVACAGKRLCMGEGAFLMIHNPWTVTMGNAEDLRKDAETLDKMRDSILGFYLGKCPGKTADDFKALMDEESWLAREECAALGFAVENYEGEFKAAASLTRRAFAKAPEAAKKLVEFRAEKPSEVEKVGSGEGEKAESSTTSQLPTSSPSQLPSDNWEARFRGASKKINELQTRIAEMEKSAADYNAVVAERDALKTQSDALEESAAKAATAILDFKSQLEQSAKDLANANAKVSELSAALDKSNAALQTATDDLAKTRDSLKAAEDKAAELVKTRDLLTAGVLTPASEGTYAEKMKSARTPEERESLRAQKRAGKIK